MVLPVTKGRQGQPGQEEQPGYRAKPESVLLGHKAILAPSVPQETGEQRVQQAPLVLLASKAHSGNKALLGKAQLVRKARA